VGAGHAATSLYVPGDTPLHRLPPQCKVAAAVLFVFAVVATPREQLWAYGVYAGAVAGLVALARLPAASVLRRLLIELPFVAFALLLPFVARGPRVDVGPLTLASDGLWGAWNILAKGTLGVATMVVLTAVTPLPDLIRGLDRLKVPRAFTAILSFMVRYGDVVTEEMHRMDVARRSRGYDPKWFWQARGVAHAAGALFIRSYERGERVYRSMLARGWTGVMPELGGVRAPLPVWAASLGLPVAAAAVAGAAWLQA
jgi:cobalt/nickel transport system permease protein